MLVNGKASRKLRQLHDRGLNIVYSMKRAHLPVWDIKPLPLAKKSFKCITYKRN